MPSPLQPATPTPLNPHCQPFQLPAEFPASSSGTFPLQWTFGPSGWQPSYRCEEDHRLHDQAISNQNRRDSAIAFSEPILSSKEDPRVSDLQAKLAIVEERASKAETALQDLLHRMRDLAISSDLVHRYALQVLREDQVQSNRIRELELELRLARSDRENEKGRKRKRIEVEPVEESTKRQQKTCRVVSYDEPMEEEGGSQELMTMQVKRKRRRGKGRRTALKSAAREWMAF